MEKVHLGDGVYAEYLGGGEMILTTENGVSVTNRIVFGPWELSSLSDYIDKIKAELEKGSE